MSSVPPEHSEDQARRAAKRVGLKARKSRWRAGSIDNFGNFMIIDPMRNWIVAGTRFDFTADDVVAFCAEYGRNVEAGTQEQTRASSRQWKER